MITVLYISSENTTTSIPLEVADYMGKSDMITLHIVSYYGTAPGEPPSFAKNVIDLNIPKSNIKEGFSKVDKLIKEIKPDIVHVHHNMSALISILAAKYNKINLVVKTEHNDHRFLKWYQKVFNIPILFLADLVICNSVSTKNSFYSWEKFLSNKKAISIYNGININRISELSENKNRNHIKEKYRISPNERLFFCAARLIKQKNFENLIKAFTAASDENKNIRLLIAGSGNLYNVLLALKEQLDKFNKIQFLGILPRNDVFELMNAADFFVMVSIWEGFCNAVVEAMAARCPVICSDIATLREVVGDEVGRFVNPKSPNCIKKGILEFAALDNDVVKLLGEKSFKRASELYDIESTANQYLYQYRKANNHEKENNLYSRI